MSFPCLNTLLLCSSCTDFLGSARCSTVPQRSWVPCLVFPLAQPGALWFRRGPEPPVRCFKWSIHPASILPSIHQPSVHHPSTIHPAPIHMTVHMKDLEAAPFKYSPSGSKMSPKIKHGSGFPEQGNFMYYTCVFFQALRRMCT